MSKPKRSIVRVVPEPGPGRAWCAYWYASDDPTGTPPGVDVYRTQKLAVAAAVTWAKDYEPSQVFCHGRDGKILWERTYPRTSDPSPPPGLRKAKGRRK